MEIIRNKIKVCDFRLQIDMIQNYYSFDDTSITFDMLNTSGLDNINIEFRTKKQRDDMLSQLDELFVLDIASKIKKDKLDKIAKS